MKNTTTETKSAKPFGLEFLEEMSEQELQQYNGGRHHHKKPPLHTMGLSGPTAGHPNGDYHG